MSAILKIQDAVYDRLSQDTGITSKVKGVFDYVKQNQKMPFVVLGEIASTKYKTKIQKGEEITQTIYVVSSYRGKKETEEIINAIETALETDITIASYKTYMSNIDFIEVFRDGEDTIQGEIKLKIRVMEV